MDKVSCLICGRPHERETCHIIVLTEEERALVPDPKDEYPYCKPCWRALSDPKTGPALASGIAAHRLRLLGVNVSEEALVRFQAKLTAKIS